jgi:heterodisulfide reductase subunit C2
MSPRRNLRRNWRSNSEALTVITIKKSTSGRSLQQAVEQLSGTDLSLCLQCKKCSNGCPVAKLTPSRPAEIVRRIQLGAGNELLSDELIWMCASCETCSVRCPMGIDVAGVMDALRRLALDRGAPKPAGDVPLFNRAFLKTVETFGRSYEIGMIAAYKLGTGQWMKDTDKFPGMLKKGKIALLPPRGADKKTIKRIFGKTKANKGAQA